jgi:fructokinase
MKPKIVGIGEVLWDLLPGGKQLGGAPANFACHAVALGADAHIVSRVGSDAHGDEVLTRLQRIGLPTDCIEIDPIAPTGTVSVAISAGGQPQFTIHENVAWDRMEGGERAQRVVDAARAVCFGTLAQRSETSRAAIRRLVGRAGHALRILDVNLRQHFYSRDLIHESLSIANVLKVNDAELPLLAEMFGLRGNTRAQMVELKERYALRAVACTRGKHGSLLFAAGTWSDHPGVPIEVVDTVGAGDAFTAAMALGLLFDWPLDITNHLANRVAAYVASCAGATPQLPDDLRRPFVSPELPGPEPKTYQPL